MEGYFFKIDCLYYLGKKSIHLIRVYKQDKFIGSTILDTNLGIHNTLGCLDFSIPSKNGELDAADNLNCGCCEIFNKFNEVSGIEKLFLVRFLVTGEFSFLTYSPT